jgi:lysophospholipase L1-like esterase
LRPFLPAGEYDPDQPPPRDPGHERIEALNRRIKSLAERKHSTLVDYHATLSDHRGYYLRKLTADGVHPFAGGYQRVEPLLREAVAAALFGPGPARE